MIYLSHNYKDKDIVEPIAVQLKKIYGKDKVFYDSWSIAPWVSIIGKMNEVLKQFNETIDKIGRDKFITYEDGDVEYIWKNKPLKEH